jgi:actin-related protein 2
VGAAATINSHELALSYPMANGIVQDWNDMGLIWDHAFFKQLQVDASSCQVLLTDPALNPTANRQKMLEVMFEKYNFAGAHVQVQAVLTLYAQGKLKVTPAPSVCVL